MGGGEEEKKEKGEGVCERKKIIYINLNLV